MGESEKEIYYYRTFTFRDLSRLIFVFLLIYGERIINRESVKRRGLQAKLDGKFWRECIATRHPACARPCVRS